VRSKLQRIGGTSLYLGDFGRRFRLKQKSRTRDINEVAVIVCIEWGDMQIVGRRRLREKPRRRLDQKRRDERTVNSRAETSHQDSDALSSKQSGLDWVEGETGVTQHSIDLVALSESRPGNRVNPREMEQLHRVRLTSDESFTYCCETPLCQCRSKCFI
jgi:hypothetical protein